MKQDDIAAIRNLSLFRLMREDTFLALIEAGFLQRFPPGVVLIEERDRADFLHIVVEGQVEMFATTAGRETTTDLLRPVDTFILAAVLSDQVYLQSARTLEASRILMIPAEKVRATMAADPAFMRAISVELARAYRTAVRDLKNLKLRTGAERLANWLLRTNAEQGNRNRVEIAFEKRTLASRLGMTPENLSRAFAALRPYGVKVKGPEVDLTQPQALAEFAKPDPMIDGCEENLS
ncbi:cyclic nucleotide-binding domain-containing protein [Methylovirgula sp. HY1]|uniref:cyclic nucleotide-binding domain-containing protein n=1 Tax=Methylovirgula sp. HY1 TaxID=2822761 RepID=UPI001C5AD088|nr:cyclic nucleotide-binding domain-containing protein [Methylovirgula sp. HY1]